MRDLNKFSTNLPTQKNIKISCQRIYELFNKAIKDHPNLELNYQIFITSMYELAQLSIKIKADSALHDIITYWNKMKSTFIKELKPYLCFIIVDYLLLLGIDCTIAKIEGESKNIITRLLQKDINVTYNDKLKDNLYSSCIIIGAYINRYIPSNMQWIENTIIPEIYRNYPDIDYIYKKSIEKCHNNSESKELVDNWKNIWIKRNELYYI